MEKTNNKTCPNCGAQIPGNSTFCPYCGSQLHDTISVNPLPLTTENKDVEINKPSFKNSKFCQILFIVLWNILFIAIAIIIFFILMFLLMNKFNAFTGLLFIVIYLILSIFVIIKINKNEIIKGR